MFALPEPMLQSTLEQLNPWWSGRPQPPLPPLRRWAFLPALNRLTGGSAPVTVLRGPRQIGKSTLVRQIIEKLLNDGTDPSRILFVQFDELPVLVKREQPILLVARSFEQRQPNSSYNEIARSGTPAYLFFDEVQNLTDWAPQIKSLVDNSAVRVMVTGSSALRIEAGRDSLAGRISTLEMGPLLLREVAELRGDGVIPAFSESIEFAALRERDTWISLRAHGERFAEKRDVAFRQFSERGAYPLAHTHPDVPWNELANELNETVVKRAIEHDLRTSSSKGAKRDSRLLEQVFRLACRYDGQSPKVSTYRDEINASMSANVGVQRVAQYMKFLDGALLIRLIEPLELRLKKTRGASKVVLCDHALRASWLQEVVPLDAEGLNRAEHLRDLAGRIVEGVVGSFLRSQQDLAVAHFPERVSEPEVDFVVTVGESRIPIEVKYRRRIDSSDERGLVSFIEKRHYHAPFGIIVVPDDNYVSSDPRIVALPLSTFLLLR